MKIKQRKNYIHVVLNRFKPTLFFFFSLNLALRLFFIHIKFLKMLHSLSQLYCFLHHLAQLNPKKKIKNKFKKPANNLYFFFLQWIFFFFLFMYFFILSSILFSFILLIVKVMFDICISKTHEAVFISVVFTNDVWSNAAFFFVGMIFFLFFFFFFFSFFLFIFNSLHHE